MTFLSAAQSAALRLVGRKPATFFGATSDIFLSEICDLANDVAADIVKENEWRSLTKLKEITGNGVLTAFPMPADYDRMPLKGGVFRPSWGTDQYSPAQDLDLWRKILNGAPTIAPGHWIILDGQMQIYPAVPDADKAQFYYISKNIVLSGSTPQPGFTADTDVFTLGDRLLTLGLIWKWRAQKRMEYAEDMANYEKAMAEAAGTDKGSRIFAVGRPTINANVGMAYPWPLGGY